MKLLFSASRLIGSRLIRLATWSEFSHVQAVIGDRLLGAQFPGGVCYEPLEKRLGEATRACYAEIVFPTLEQEARAASFLAAQIGKPYDWGAVFGLGLHRDWADERRWFCSELIAAAARAACYDLVRLDAWRVTPEHLLESVRVDRS